MRRAELAFVVLAVTASCGPSLPPDYVRHADAAESATRRRDHATAAAEWAKAADVADSNNDRHEALYRQATSRRRAGDTAGYLRLLGALSQTPGPRQVRAAYDLALARLELEPAAGGHEVRAVVLQFPDSGLARGAVDRWMDTLTPDRRIQQLTALEAAVGDPHLKEHLLMQTGKNQELLELDDAALSSYRSVVTNHPYPEGRYWDVAILRCAVLWLRKGEHSNAESALESMLSHREQAAFVGSYERHYAEASLLLAYVALHTDWRKAHQVLRAFPAAYPLSRHRDEALWAAALLARDNALPEEACKDAQTLHESAAGSRYAGCVSRLCDALPSTGECREYIVRDRGSAEATLRAALARHLERPQR